MLSFSMHLVTGHKLVALMKIPFRAVSVTEASRDCISESSKHIRYITVHLQPETILESAGETVWTLWKVFLPNSPVKIIKAVKNSYSVADTKGVY